MGRIILTLLAAVAALIFGAQLWEGAGQALAATFYWIFP